MTHSTHRLLREIFEQALDLPAERRAAFLDARCAGYPALRQRLEAMLAAAADEHFLSAPTHGSSDGTAARPAAPAERAGIPAVSSPISEGPGTRVGPYRLLQSIGEGGFGVVFMAEQEQPVRRRVALKILKLGMDTRQVVARFERERQALAMMDHPNIARVIDAGATETGRPYFVMELVQGDPIVEYCDERNLSIDQRLELMSQVCAAVQHAHQKGIIHRDLKPSNILVGTQDGRPLAKVIDFGIAKATAEKLTEATLFTEHRQVIGTFQYMSPEQAEGSLDIDTRTDVYSLGVLLYELLTGTTPFEKQTLQDALFGEIQRIIREVDPPRPSTRLSASRDRLASIAAQRGIEPRRLSLILRGDLDWIVMKALEKDRARRYESASDLATDLRRHLTGEPVNAAPPSAGYRLRKFVRRNRGLVTGAGAVSAALLLGIVGFAWQAGVARDQRDAARFAKDAESKQRRIVDEQRAEAKARADEFELVAEFQATMLEQIDATRAGRELSEDVLGRFDAALAKAEVPDEDRAALSATFREQWRRVDATDVARAMLDRALLKPSAAAIEREFADHPGIAGKLQHRLAFVYRELGLYAAALPLQRSALAIRRKWSGDDASVTLDSMNSLGLLLYDLGEIDEAEQLYREALEARVRTSGSDDPETARVRDNLSVLLTLTGRSAEAEPLERQALEDRRRKLGDDHPQTLNSMSNLALVLEGSSRFDEAEAMYRDVLSRRRRVLGNEDAATLATLSNLGLLLKEQNELAEAEALLREAAQTRRRVFGEDHPNLWIPLNNLGLVLQAQGKFTEAETIARDVLAARERLLGKDHTATQTARNNLAMVLTALDRPAEAEQIQREVLASLRRALGAEHPNTLSAINNLAMALQAQDKMAEAEPLQREVLEGLRKVLGDDHPNTIHSHVNLGSVLRALGRNAEAEELFRTAVSASRRALGEGHPAELSATGSLARLLAAESRFDEVVTLLAPSIPHFRLAPGERSASSLARMLIALGRSRAKTAKTTEAFTAAAAELHEAEALLVGIPGQRPGDRRECLQALVEMEAAWAAIEPAQGHAEASQAWQAKLEALPD